MRTAARLGALFLLFSTLGDAHAGGPAPSEAGAKSATVALARAQDALQGALASLASAPSRATLDQAHRAMQAIQSGIDVYFHGAAPKTPKARAAFGNLRTEVMRLLGGAEPILIVSDDVLRFQPALHRRLAAVSVRFGQFRHAIEHLRAAQAVDGSRTEDLEALLVAHRGAGDPRGALAVEAELRALKGLEATAAGHP